MTEKLFTGTLNKNQNKSKNKSFDWSFRGLYRRLPSHEFQHILFLAQLSRRLVVELIVYTGIRCPSVVRPSVVRQHFQRTPVVFFADCPLCFWVSKNRFSHKAAHFIHRKLVSLDMKLENRLNMKDLDRLQDAFMVSQV